MKNRFTYRKEFESIAKELGLDTPTVLAGYEDSTTKTPHFALTNNKRRFVKGMLELPLREQESRIAKFKSIIAEQKLADTAKEGV